MRAHAFPTRLISLSLIASLLNLISLPAQAAYQQQAVQAKQQPSAGKSANHLDSAAEQLYELTAHHALSVQQLKTGRSIHKAEWYADLWHKVTRLFTDDAEEIAVQAGTEGVIAQVLALRLQVEQDQTALMTELAAQSRALHARHAAPKILQRQAELIRQLDARHQRLQGLLTQLATAQGTSARRDALTALQQQLAQWQPVQAKTDLQHLPWGSPDNSVRQPITADTAGRVTPASFGLDPAVSPRTSQPNGAIQQWRATEYRIARYLRDRHPLQPAAAPLSGTTPSGDWPVLKSLPADIQPADTAATEDAQQSPAIQALATQLHHNPAEIYKWVYDTIEYLPTYGSIQGADFTLQTKRGNAFDTASVLIALLRASNIPARYVYGTVDIPAKAAQDWVGGVNNLDAAQNLLSQGGVPTVGLTKNGVPVMLRMEHVWVEANLAMLPSRGGLGADVTTGQATQWVPLDASYKHMQRTPSRIDYLKEFPIDTQALQNALTSGMTVNTTFNYVQGMNPQAYGSKLNDYYFTIDGHFSQEDPNLVTEKSINISNIRSYNSKLLSPLLPYSINTVVGDYQKLPDSMRAKFNVSIYQNSVDKETGNPILSYSDSLPNLARKKINVSFAPSTSADQAVLESYKDATSLPVNLIRMKPQILVGDNVVATGNSDTAMGQALIAVVNIELPAKNYSGYTESIFKTGDERVLGLNLAGTPYNALYQEYLRKFGQKKTASDNLYLLSLNFWMLEDFTDFLISQKRNFIINRLPSYGWFSSPLHTKQRYGIAYNGFYHVRSLDIVKSEFSAVGLDNTTPLDGLLQIGVNNSYLEGAMFDYPARNPVGKGISASRLIVEAAQSGQKIYTITKSNYGNILPKLNVSADVLSTINNAVASNKIVIVPESDITKGAWSGLGYIVFDLQNGSGAYLLNGGSNGGYENPNCQRQPQTSPVVDEVSPLLAVAVILGIAAIAVATEGVGLIALAGTAEAAMASLAASGAAALRVVQFGVGAGAIFYAEGAMAAFPPVPPGLPPVQLPPVPEFIEPTCPEDVLINLEAVKKSACSQSFSCSQPPNRQVYPGYCDSIKEKIGSGLNCVSSRLNVMNTCFGGGDRAHHDEVNKTLYGDPKRDGSYRGGVYNCQLMYAKYCESGCN